VSSDEAGREAAAPSGPSAQAELSQPKSVAPLLHVMIALVAALGCAAIVIAILSAGERRIAPREAKPARAPSTEGAIAETATASTQRLESPPARPRPVPVEVLKTASVVASPHAPGLRLLRSTMNAAWERRRAEIEDRTSGESRTYAIGDLLPHGSLLVGISTTTADIMVGDAHLVRLHEDGRIEPIEDLSKAEIGGIVPVKGAAADPVDSDKVRLALIDVRGDDPTQVQAAIDELIAGGDPAVEILMPQVDSLLPVRQAEYAFPSGSELQARPKVLGEIVMLVLERITGQKFGDVAKEELKDEERRRIARAWRRWWTGE
jgi:hypothetical protein